MEILLSCVSAWQISTRVIQNTNLPYEIRLEIIRTLDDYSGNQCSFNHIKGYPYGNV